jgi:putative spermidine/putrescine transport system permease protein
MTRRRSIELAAKADGIPRSPALTGGPGVAASSDAPRSARKFRDTTRDPIQLPWRLISAPAMLVLCGLFAAPIVALIYKSLFKDLSYGRLGQNLTIENYTRFFSDPFYLAILGQTLLIGFITVTVCVLLGYPVAYFLARTHSRYRGILIFLVVAPMLISVVIRNLGWVPVLSSNGLVNWLLIHAGLIEQPLVLLHNTTGVIIGLTQSLIPYMILTLLAVIQRIDHSVEEASMSLGAPPWQTFRRVVLPMSRPGLLGGYLLVLTTSIAAFTTPAVLGGGRVLIMPIYIEQQMRAALRYGFGGALATALILTIASARAEER